MELFSQKRFTVTISCLLSFHCLDVSLPISCVVLSKHCRIPGDFFLICMTEWDCLGENPEVETKCRGCQDAEQENVIFSYQQMKRCAAVVTTPFEWKLKYAWLVCIQVEFAQNARLPAQTSHCLDPSHKLVTGKYKRDGSNCSTSLSGPHYKNISEKPRRSPSGGWRRRMVHVQIQPSHVLLALSFNGFH